MGSWCELAEVSRCFWWPCGLCAASRPSIAAWILAMHLWRCAVAEQLCGHHKAWNESGLVSLSSGQRLTALPLGLSTPSTRKPVRPLCVIAIYYPGGNNQEGGGGTGLCGCWQRCRWERVPLVWGRVGGAGQMVRLQHLPPAQLHRALLAASYEGHVCAAGPGHVQAAPCQVGGVQGKGQLYWVEEGRA